MKRLLPLLFLLPILIGQVQGAAGAALPEAMVNTTTASDGRAIYLFGGTQGRPERPTDDVLRYDPATGAVEHVADLPSPRASVGAVWTGTVFVLMGGTLAQGLSDEILHFEPGSNKVRRVAALPEPLSKPGVVWNGTHVLVAGGLRPCAAPCPATSEGIFSYDPMAGTVEKEAATLPIGTAGPTFWDGHRLFILGGYSSDGRLSRFTDQILRYDPRQGTVETLDTRLPDRVMGAEVVWDGRRAYLFGGEIEPGALTNRILVFDPLTGRVEVAEATLPDARSSFGLAMDANAAYVFGGRGCDASPACSTILTVDPRGGVASTAEVVGTLPVAGPTEAFWDGTSTVFVVESTRNPGQLMFLRWNATSRNAERVTSAASEPMAGTAIAAEGKLIHLLVADNASLPNSIAHYDPDTQQVRATGTAIPSPRKNAAGVALNGRAYFIGGQGTELLAEILEYDPRNDTIRVLETPLPEGRENAAAFADGTYLYILGGAGPQGPTATIWRYNPRSKTLDDAGRLPEPITGATAVWTGDTAYLLGGCTKTTCPTDAIWSYSPHGNAASVVPARLAVARQDLGAAWNGTTFLIAGGRITGSSPSETAPIMAFTPTVVTVAPTIPHEEVPPPGLLAFSLVVLLAACWRANRYRR